MNCLRVNHHFQQVVLNTVLAYVVNSMSNSDNNAIKRTCLDFYTYSELVEAKNVLWDVGDTKLLPPKKSRRDSTKKPAIDSIMADILNGLSCRDTAGKVPHFAIDSANLNRLPRAMPSENLPISICERLANIENRLKNTEEAISLNAIKTLNI